MRCDGSCQPCVLGAGPRRRALTGLLPKVPLRHWVLTVPPALRIRLAEDEPLTRLTTRRFVAELFAVYRERITGHMRVAAKDLRFGAATAVHRVGAGLRLNVHVHALVLDGAYRVDRPRPVFLVPPRPPGPRDLASVAAKVWARVRTHIADSVAPAASGRPDRAEAVQQPLPGTTPRTRHDAAGVRGSAAGLQVYSGDAVPPSQRRRVQALADYVLRPGVSPETVADAVGGSGAERVRQRLALLGPHGQRPSFHGLLAPRAADRWVASPQQLRLLPDETSEKSARPTPASSPCPQCGGAMEAIAVEERGAPLVEGADVSDE